MTVSERLGTTSGPRAWAIRVFLAFSLCIPWLARSSAYIPPMTKAQISEIQRRANAGDAEAESELGDYYHDGAHGFRVNLKRAARWYLEAAKRGDARAQATIGEMYEFGEGVRQDHEEALMWIRKGTVKWPQSAVGVAFRYERGFNAPVDLAKAIDWYRISAEAGYVIAQASLGELYESGSGVQNLKEAVRWYREAAAQRWGPAMSALGHLYAIGKGVPQNYNEAATWYRRAIDASSGSAGQYELGLLYEEGLGVPEDHKKAMELYHGVAAGNADAQRRLFRLYEADLGIPADPDKVIAWYRVGAERGDRRAQVGLGLHYQYGRGVAKNIYVAYALYTLAQRQSEGRDDIPNFVTPRDTGFPQMGASTLALAKEMSKPGNLLKAIERFLEHPPPEMIFD